MKRILSSLILISSFSASAQIVVYTDQGHPPVGVTPAIRVVYLDASERWLQQQFGELSSDPEQAVRQAHSLLNSPDWKRRQKALIEHYRGMIEAWQLGLLKYPAVVFDKIGRA
ncbi:TIGR03757 family integrating conjugative element protein, partial [Salmonella enterica]|uniref:TIGR03757 family integrating conjugative element protein n=1 Tax=Salmonella enterica TaxID=28901 RepID=UPI0011BA89BD